MHDFRKIMLKMRLFKCTGEHRPFVNVFFPKLDKDGHRPLRTCEVIQASLARTVPKPLLTKFTGGWDEINGVDEVSKVSFNFLYTLWLYR